MISAFSPLRVLLLIESSSPALLKSRSAGTEVATAERYRRALGTSFGYNRELFFHHLSGHSALGMTGDLMNCCTSVKIRQGSV